MIKDLHLNLDNISSSEFTKILFNGQTDSSSKLFISCLFGKYSFSINSFVYEKTDKNIRYKNIILDVFDTTNKRIDYTVKRIE